MLIYRRSKKVISHAIDMTKSEDPRERSLGAEVLSGAGNHIIAIDALVSLLNDEDERVLWTSVSSLGNRSVDIVDEYTANYYVDKALPRLIDLRDHHSPEIRIKVACALSFMVGFLKLPAEIQHRILGLLLDMGADPDAGVRIEVADTVALADHDRHDGILLTNSLVPYISDESPEVRASALYGLSTLRYPDIVDLLIKEIPESDYVYDYLLDAVIEEVPDPRLLPVLLELKKKKVDDEGSRKLLKKAIKACSRELRPASDSKPITHIPDDEAWLFQNKEAIALVRAGLRDAAEGRGIDGGSFMQYLDEEIGNNQDTN